MNRIRIGVIGLAFGQHLVRTLASMDEAHLVAVADRSPNVPGGLDDYARRYGAKAYTDSVAMLAHEELDAVCIAVSPKSRAPIIEQAAERNLPMFVEKPWASNLQHAHKLAAICEKHNATVMLGFSFRFHAPVVRLRQLLDSDLGPAWMLNGEYVFAWSPPPDHWLWAADNGNGFFNENSGHLFDVVCHLLGKPRSVMAEAGNFNQRPSEDAAAVTIGFEGGAIAALTIGGIGAAAHQDYPRIDVATQHGQARLWGKHHMWESLTWAARTDKDTHTFTELPEVLGTTRYTRAMKHFFACVRSGEKPTATISDGITAVALAEAVYESARSGRKVSVNI